MSKKLKVIAISVVSLGLALAGFGAVKAATDTQNPMSSLIQAIATRFNLNVADVQQVFDEHHDQMMAQKDAQREEFQAQRQQKFTERLNQAVIDGKLTQAQAVAILAKKAEMEVFMTSLKNKTKTERQEAMKTQMESLKQWLTDNNIPTQYVPFVGFGMGKGMMGEGPRGHGRGMMNDDFDSQSENSTQSN